MGFMAEATGCFRGVVAGTQRQRAPKLVKVALPPPQLPQSIELPARLAAELGKAHCGTERQCAVAGVLCPTLAALLGAADGLDLGDEQRELLRVACRRELRELAHVMGAEASPGRLLDVLLEWCSTPAVPTYGVGLRLALNLDADPLRPLAEDLAWVFRLLCSRQRINARQAAPMLFGTCELLCRSKASCQDWWETIGLGLAANRSVSVCAGRPTEQLGNNDRHRCHSQPCLEEWGAAPVNRRLAGRC